MRDLIWDIIDYSEALFLFASTLTFFSLCLEQ